MILVRVAGHGREQVDVGLRHAMGEVHLVADRERDRRWSRRHLKLRDAVGQQRAALGRGSDLDLELARGASGPIRALAQTVSPGLAVL